MTPEEFRQALLSARIAAAEEAEESKNSTLVHVRLSALYRRLDADERALADDVISDWVLSHDEAARFDALALIGEFRIIAAVPALRTLMTRLSSSAAPGAPYERQKADRIIAALAVANDPAAR